MKMVPFMHAPPIHIPFRLQPVRGWLMSSIYLVAMLCVHMCDESQLRFGAVIRSSFVGFPSHILRGVLVFDGSSVGVLVQKYCRTCLDLRSR